MAARKPKSQTPPPVEVIDAEPVVANDTFAPRTALPLVRVPVHGEEVLAAQDGDGDPDDNVWVIIKRVCESLGLSPHAQAERLKGKAWAVARMKRVTAPDGKTYEMLCISLRSLPLWLATIEPSRVAEAARPKLELFQLHCRDVLYKHFFRQSPPEPRVVEEKSATVPKAKAMVDWSDGVGRMLNGTIGRHRAHQFILVPIREIAELTVALIGREDDPKLYKRQLAKATKETDNELRVRLGFHQGAAQRWDSITDETLGHASRHLWNIFARVRSQLSSRETVEAKRRILMLPGMESELATTQKRALGGGYRGAN